MAQKVSKKKFLEIAFAKLKKPYKDKRTGEMRTPSGLHTVYSGFNAAWEDYYGTNPVEAVSAMVENGNLEGHPTKGGFMIYLPGTMSKGNRTSGTKALQDMELL